MMHQQAFFTVFYQSPVFLTKAPAFSRRLQNSICLQVNDVVGGCIWTGWKTTKCWLLRRVAVGMETGLAPAWVLSPPSTMQCKPTLTIQQTYSTYSNK